MSKLGTCTGTVDDGGFPRPCKRPAVCWRGGKQVCWGHADSHDRRDERDNQRRRDERAAQRAQALGYDVRRNDPGRVSMPTAELERLLDHLHPHHGAGWAACK